MMLGPPIAGAFNEYLFTGDDGVRFSIIVLVTGFLAWGPFLLGNAVPTIAAALVTRKPGGNTKGLD